MLFNVILILLVMMIWSLMLKRSFHLQSNFDNELDYFEKFLPKKWKNIMVKKINYISELN